MRYSYKYIYIYSTHIYIYTIMINHCECYASYVLLLSSTYNGNTYM